MRVVALVVFLLLCSRALGQIDGPAESEPYKLIRHTLATPIPEGAYLADGGWEIIGSSASVTADVEDVGNKVIWTGTPGVYSVVFDGVLLKDVTVPGMDGQPVIIKSYLGRIKSRTTCTIKGGVTPPPPPPPGKRWAVILVETKEQTTQQGILFDQLRLKPLAFRLQVWDDDQPGAAPYVRLSKLGSPVLLVLSESGELVREVRLPASVEAIEQEVNR